MLVLFKVWIMFFDCCCYHIWIFIYFKAGNSCRSHMLILVWPRAGPDLHGARNLWAILNVNYYTVPATVLYRGELWCRCLKMQQSTQRGQLIWSYVKQYFAIASQPEFINTEMVNLVIWIGDYFEANFPPCFSLFHMMIVYRMGEYQLCVYLVPAIGRN